MFLIITINPGSGVLSYIMPKRTYQPNVKKASKKHGFKKRMATKDGRNVLKSRRNKGRETLSK